MNSSPIFYLPTDDFGNLIPQITVSLLIQQIISTNTYGSFDTHCNDSQVDI